MDTRVLHKQVGKVIGLAWRELRGIPWNEYGKEIKLVDDSGNKKYQGLMIMHDPVDTSFVSTMVLGELADPGRSFKVVREKLAVLKGRATRCSIELRNPPLVWGGSVRLDNLDSWGVTGLPEVADHIAITLILYHLGKLLSLREKEEFLQVTSPGVAAARAFVDMGQEPYERLVWIMEDIIRAAAREV